MVYIWRLMHDLKYTILTSVVNEIDVHLYFFVGCSLCGGDRAKDQDLAIHIWVLAEAMHCTDHLGCGYISVR